MVNVGMIEILSVCYVITDMAGKTLFFVSAVSDRFGNDSTNGKLQENRRNRVPLPMDKSFFGMAGQVAVCRC